MSFVHENGDDFEYPPFGHVITRSEADRMLQERDATFSPLPTLPSAREPAAVPLVWGEPGELRCD